ncbi:MAG TPA: putative metal-dependent hydrolase [Terriglobales bacterium]|nr:putative metal-dependent hydrolase [Terriglobales bacterium]
MAEQDPVRYPIGRFTRGEPVPASRWVELLHSLDRFPATLRSVVAHLPPRELEAGYREGGWTVRQLVHHLPDSHLNAFVRIKLALTEDAPPVKPYDESLWAKLPDSALPVAISLDLLDALHARWTALLRALPEEGKARCFRHPDWGLIRVDETVALYEWHGRHHLAHIRAALARHTAY